MKQFRIELDFNGMVLFDPLRLVAFLKSENINTTGVFQYFLDHDAVGKKAVDHGVIIPIYPIDALDYQIEASLTAAEFPADREIIFTHDRYGIESLSGIVVFSDIYAIMEWDDEAFFLNYLDRYAEKSVHNDFFETGKGKFKVQVQGYRMENVAGGYRFLFERSDSLPAISDDAEVDDLNFSI